MKIFFATVFLLAALGITASGAEIPKSVDVCVYGGTPAGMVAAATARQEGLSVVLIEPSRWLGGVLGAGIKPLQDCPEPRSVGGLTKKHVFRLGNDPPTIRRKSVEWMAAEAVPVLYEYRVVSVEKRDTIIRSIRLEFAPPDRHGIPAPATDAEKSHRIEAKVFIDASYEGDLMLLAGVDYAVGREPRSKFDEAAAGVGPPTNWTPIDPFIEPGRPESGLLPMVDADHGKAIGDGDDYTQAYNYRFYITNDDAKKAPLGMPENYDPKDYELLGRYVEHLVRTLADNEPEWMRKLAEIFPGWRNSGDYNYKRESLFSISPLGESRFYQDGDWPTRSRIWRRHRDYLRGIHHFLSTDPRVPEKFRRETAAIGLDRTMHDDTEGWPNQLYVRISRRMQGEAVLDLHDVWNERQHESSIGLALYGVDTYPVRRYTAKDPKTGEIGVATEGNMFLGGSRGTGKPYQIPFGAILPKREQCRNLLVPLCFSSTYIAYASARMEPVFCILGESAAVAAVHAIREDRPVQDIDRNAFREKLLQRGQILEWTPPEIKKPGWLEGAGPNLARQATASAPTQFAPGPGYDPSLVNDGKADMSTNQGRWVSARGEEPHYVELRFEKPVRVDAFVVYSGKIGDGLIHPNNDFHLLSENAAGSWEPVEGASVNDNEEFIRGERFPVVMSAAFRLVITRSPENVARVWEWELYRIGKD